VRTLESALGKAVALSLLLHALVLAAGGWLLGPVRVPVAVREAQLEVTLRPSAALAPPAPTLILDETPQPDAHTPTRKRSVQVRDGDNTPRIAVSSNSSVTLVGEAARQAHAQIARELLYPPEAIARGLEGEVLVLLVLDASGNAIAARLEATSGHALLDDAAIRAARTLHSLPDSAPREVLLPVRFRLR
jgi:protein TonB